MVVKDILHFPDATCWNWKESYYLKCSTHAFPNQTRKNPQKPVFFFFSFWEDHRWGRLPQSKPRYMVLAQTYATHPAQDIMSYLKKNHCTKKRIFFVSSVIVAFSYFTLMVFLC